LGNRWLIGSAASLKAGASGAGSTGGAPAAGAISAAAIDAEASFTVISQDVSNPIPH
jgi:hypothetical protein